MQYNTDLPSTSPEQVYLQDAHREHNQSLHYSRWAITNDVWCQETACNSECVFSTAHSMCKCACVSMCEKEENVLKNSQNPRLPFRNLQSEGRDRSRLNG